MGLFSTSMAVLVTAVALAAPAASAQGQPDSSPPRRVELTGPVEVPLSLESNLPIVEARVNGQGPFRFGIETGADFVIVSPDVVSRLALTRTGGSDAYPAYTVASIEIGGARFVDMPVAAARVAQTGIDGVLGLPLYRDVLMTIDYPARRLRFERGMLPAPDASNILTLTHIGPFWGVPISIAGTAFTAVLDTRSTGGFGLTPESARDVRFDGEPRVVGRARGAAIPETEVKAATIAGDVRVGRYVFPRPTVSIRPLPPGFPTEPIVGARVLSQFVVTLDQQNARLRLARDSDLPIVLDPAAGGRATSAAPASTAGAQATTDYAGRYGSRTVRAENGKLILQRDGGPPLEMVGTGQDTFTLAEVPQAQIKFVRDASGLIVEVQILNRDGQWEKEKRVRQGAISRRTRPSRSRRSDRRAFRRSAPTAPDTAAPEAKPRIAR
jgi:hypothetical protein